MAEATNQAGYFRDFFFIVIIAAVLAILSMLDSIARTQGQLGDISLIVFLGFLGYFVLILVYGTSRFAELSTVVPARLSLPQLQHDYDLIRLTLAVGISTELAVALRERPDRID